MNNHTQEAHEQPTAKAAIFVVVFVAAVWSVLWWLA